MAIAPADVVIIGGGIVGYATAYELAKRGLHPVIIERDSIGSHASGFAFGELLPWWGRGIPGPLFDFGRRCLELHNELHPALNASTGIDTGFRLTDAVSVALNDADGATCSNAMIGSGIRACRSNGWMARRCVG